MFKLDYQLDQLKAERFISQIENSTISQRFSTVQPQLRDWCDSQSYQLPAFVKASVLIVIAGLSLMTTIGNIVILLALKRTFRLHTASKTLYFRPAVSDLFAGLFVQLVFVARLVVGPQFPKPCRIFATMANILGVVSVGVSLQTLTLVSVDRVHHHLPYFRTAAQSSTELWI